MMLADFKGSSNGDSPLAVHSRFACIVVDDRYIYSMMHGDEQEISLAHDYRTLHSTILIQIDVFSHFPYTDVSTTVPCLVILELREG